jgi:hypothetical protein
MTAKDNPGVNLRRPVDPSESVTPALNLPPGGLKVGDTVSAVVSGEMDDKHYFFEHELVIGNSKD